MDMAPNRFKSSETDSAFEDLLLKKNGDPKTVQDLFECFVAMHHDHKSDTKMVLDELRKVAESIEHHLTKDVNMSIGDFNLFMAKRDQLLKDLENRMMQEIKENCLKQQEAHALLDKEIKAIWREIHRGPRRKNDKATEDWGQSVFGGGEGAEDWWEVKKFWRAVKWAFIVAGGGLLVMAGDQLGHYLFGN